MTENFNGRYLHIQRLTTAKEAEEERIRENTFFLQKPDVDRYRKLS
jgi:hypothetical protein